MIDVRQGDCLNPAYAAMAKRRIAGDAPLFHGDDA